MISDIFFTILYQPLYNGLVFLISVMPFGDVGVAIVLLTIVVKLILFPLTHKTTKTQARMRTIEPEMKEIKEKHKDDKQEQSRKIMELYKKHGINPFSGCLLFLIQLPIIIALYWVFWKGLVDGVKIEDLYSFVSSPLQISTDFLGVLDISGKSMLLALLAGVSQFYQLKLALPPLKKREESEGPPTMKDDFARSFNLQMRYGLPIFVVFISYTISAMVALYWVTSNVFSLVHELLVKRKALAIKKGDKDDEKEEN